MFNGFYWTLKLFKGESTLLVSLKPFCKTNCASVILTAVPTSPLVVPLLSSLSMPVDLPKPSPVLRRALRGVPQG